jgi:hypothetical protein
MPGELTARLSAGERANSLCEQREGKSESGSVCRMAIIHAWRQFIPFVCGARNIITLNSFEQVIFQLLAH